MEEKLKSKLSRPNTGILTAFKDTKLSKSEKTLPMLSLSVIIISSVLFFKPLTANIAEAKTTLDGLKREYKSVEKKKLFLESKDNESEQKLLSRRLEYMEKYVPSIKPSLQTLIHISRLSRLQNIEFSGLSLNPGAVKIENVESEGDRLERLDNETPVTEGLSNFEVQFSIVGKKDNLLDFVSKLNEVSPLMKVEFFNTAFVQDATGKTNEDTAVKFDKDAFLQATLRLLVYYKDTPDILPALEEVDAIVLSPEEEQFLTEIEDYLFLDERFIMADDVIVDAPLGKSNPFTNPLTTPPAGADKSSIVVNLDGSSAAGANPALTNPAGTNN